MSENDPVQSLGRRLLPQKKHEGCREFDPEKQREYFVRAQRLAKEILTRESK
jgi:hypothetical protein